MRIMKSAYKTTPAGVRNIGSMGDGVNPDFIRSKGSRAQRRLLDRHLKREAAKEKARKKLNVPGGAD